MRPEPSPRRALAHPVWWTALGLLLLNDHVLKHAGVLPGWLTGKLSDVAGLIVAPVLAAALLGARAPRARAAAFALPVLPFVAINLVPAFAAWVERASLAVGFPWRVWADPTDLVALAALPGAWWLLEAHAPGARRRAVEGVAAVLGAAACIATSAPPPAEPFFQTTTYLMNHTPAAVDVRVRWIDADVSCADIRGEAARALSPELFGEGRTYRLEPNGVIPLERGAAMAGADGGFGVLDCDAALVQVDGLPRTVVFWRGIFSQSVSAVIGPEDPRPEGGVAIEPDGASLRLASDDLELAPALDRTEPSGCGLAGAPTFEWSFAGLPPYTSFVLQSAETGVDGCLALELMDDLDASVHRGFLCVPDWAFPYGPGDRLIVAGGEASLDLRRELDDGTLGAALILRKHVHGLEVDGLRGALVPAGCGADRLACGAYASPVELVLDGGLGTVRPGASLDVTARDGRGARVALGRAEQLWVAHPDCEPGRRELGTSADVIVLYEEGAR